MWNDGQVVRGRGAWCRRLCKKSWWKPFFGGKFMSVCGKNLLDSKCHWKNTRRYTKKYPQIHRKKIPEYLRLFAEVPGLTTSIWRKIHENLKQCIIHSTPHFALPSPPHPTQGLHWTKVVESGPLHHDAPQDPGLQEGQDKVWITRSIYSRKEVAHLLSRKVCLWMNLVELRITFRNVHTAVMPPSVLNLADWGTPTYRIPDSGMG